MLALWLEHKFTKDQILEIYLNRVYLGAGDLWRRCRGAALFRQIGAQRHALRGGGDRRAAEGADALQPGARQSTPPPSARDQVLANMVDAGYITEAQAARRRAPEERELAKPRATPPGSRYFADWVASSCRASHEAQGRDIVVATTLDPRMQAEAEAAVHRYARARRRQSRWSSEGALVAMSPDGAVRAMVGGRDYADSQFNRATQALRQPGSSFKPFVYLAALEHGVTAERSFQRPPASASATGSRTITRTSIAAT